MAIVVSGLQPRVTHRFPLASKPDSQGRILPLHLLHWGYSTTGDATGGTVLIGFTLVLAIARKFVLLPLMFYAQQSGGTAVTFTILVDLGENRPEASPFAWYGYNLTPMNASATATLWAVLVSLLGGGAGTRDIGGAAYHGINPVIPPIFGRPDAGDFLVQLETNNILNQAVGFRVVAAAYDRKLYDMGYAPRLPL